MEYFEPKSIGHALSLLSRHGAEAKVIAGGTDVMVDIKFKEEPGALVNIKKIPSLAGITASGTSLRIDHILLSAELARSCKSCAIDSDFRAKERPSDHAPVIADI